MALHWDCRWPDPVALQVASERVLLHLRSDRSARQADLHPRLPVMVRLLNTVGDGSLADGQPVQAILVTPWAAERIYWNHPGRAQPSVRSAFPLEGDEAGRVGKGQGVLLDLPGGPMPVVIGWEPETGHYFIESLIRPVLAFDNPDSLMTAALRIIRPDRPSQEAVHPLQQPVSRRRLFRWLG